MADKKISELTADTTVTGTEQIPVNDSGVTKRMTTAQLKSYAEADALSIANTANGTANTALANAATAQGTANTANGTANTALANANNAQNTANNAANAASNAQGTATNAANAAATAQNTANDAANVAAAAGGAASTAQNTANNAANAAANAAAVAAGAQVTANAAYISVVGPYLNYANSQGLSYGFSLTPDSFAVMGQRFTVLSTGVSRRARFEFTARYKTLNNNLSAAPLATLHQVRNGVDTEVSIHATPYAAKNDFIPVRIVYYGDTREGDVYYVAPINLGELTSFDSFRFDIMCFT